MRLIGYARVSTRGQVIHGTSLPGQKKAIRKWCKDGGHRLLDICEDGAVSGTKALHEREGMYCALEVIRDKRADGIVLQNLDRFARELTVQEGALAAIWGHGGRVFCYESGEVLRDDPDDPMRTAMRQMQGVFAQLERALVVKRLRTGRLRKAEAGGYAVGGPRYGHRAEGRALVPDAGEQATLDRIRELHTADASLRQIAATLTAEGYRPKRSDRWHPETLKRIIARL